MSKQRIFLACLLFSIFLTSNSQSFTSLHLNSLSFSRADSIALNFPKGKYNNYEDLALLLTKGVDDELTKFRVIYRWIAENIEYDEFHRSSKAKKALKKRKAVCLGYSNLLSQMCLAVGINCETIVGFSKHSVYHMDKPYKKYDHSWNAVKLKGKWYLCDVTWSSGFYDERSEKVIKNFSDTYFLMPPREFIYNHFPKETTWQLIDSTMSKSTFTKLPFTYPAFFSMHINHIPIKNGKLKLKLKDTLTFELKTNLQMDSVNMEIEGLKKRYTSVFTRSSKDHYLVKQKFDTPDESELIVYVNHKAILGYRIKITK